MLLYTVALEEWIMIKEHFQLIKDYCRLNHILRSRSSFLEVTHRLNSGIRALRSEAKTEACDWKIT